MAQPICVLNGRYQPLDRARISPMDVGFLRGFAVFEFLRTYGGQPFLFNEHWERLVRSTGDMNLKLVLKPIQTRRMITELLRRNHLADAYIKIVVSGGDSQDGMTYDPAQPTTLIIAQPIHAANPRRYSHGVTLGTVEYHRPFAELKTTNYLNLLRLQETPVRKRSYEILYIDHGQVLEGATSSFFGIKGKTIITAKDEVLEGTMKRLVLKLAQGHFTIAHRTVRVSEIPKLDEAFITSTTRNIIPVVKIDRARIGSGRVGEQTTWLMNRLNQEIDRFMAPMKKKKQSPNGHS